MQFEQPEIKGIYLDMDGPLVDDEAMFKKLCPSVANMKDHIEKLKIFGQKQKFVFPLIEEGIGKLCFEKAKPTFFAQVLKTVLLPYWKEKGIQVEILSSTMANNPQRQSLIDQKKAWLKANHLDHLPCHLVEGSLKKQEYAKEGWLLIDDYDRTIGQFIKAGGYAIHYTNLTDVMYKLRLIGLAPKVF